MNFLAHIYLSGELDELMVGNFMGDFVKGKNFSAFSDKVVHGIKLHREIDWYTDNHDIVDKSKERLWANYRHYSSVIIDMFYDHFLAKNWPKYCDESLEVYTKKAFDVLKTNFEILPAKAQYMLPFMVDNNWLLAYRKVDGLKRALSGMSKRTKFESNLEKSIHELELHYDEFDDEFQLFFPQIIAHVKDFKLNLTNHS